jgi:hypothetical protein
LTTWSILVSSSIQCFTLLRNDTTRINDHREIFFEMSGRKHF